MGVGESPILSVIEQIPGQKLNLQAEEIYSPEYWQPYLPVNATEFKCIEDMLYSFRIEDTIRLDPTGTLSRAYNAKGCIKIDFKGSDPKKGAKWDFKINVETPNAIVKGSIRARNLDSSLKIGIFLYQLESNDPIFTEIGKDPIFFAIRWYLRKLLRNFEDN